MALLSPDGLLAKIAADQFGVFTLKQALACGLSNAAIKRRLAAGRFIRLLPQVYAFADSPPGKARDLFAAVAWAGFDRSAASHRSAAANYGLRGFRLTTPEISTVGRQRPRDLDIIAHRVDKHLLDDIVIVNNIPTTSIRRTLLDLAGRKHPRTEVCLDQCLLEERTTLGQMALLYEEAWTRGRRGIAILRDLLLQRIPGEAPTKRDLELLMLKVIRRFSIPKAEREFAVELPWGTAHLDFSYPEIMLNIETDGYAWHMDRPTWENDHERDVELQSIGWTVLRFTWAQLKYRPEWVAKTILSNIERLTALHRG